MSVADITLLLNNYGQDMDQDDDGKSCLNFCSVVSFNVKHLSVS